MDYHKPVLLHESVAGLNVKKDGVYVDVTFGAGGHSREIIKNLGVKGHLYGVDQDEDAVSNVLDSQKFTFLKSNFKWVGNFLELHGVLKVDGILADLGVSSHQFDVPDRGFTYRDDGPLDMRMNQYAEKSAADVLNTYKLEALISVFSEYGEVRNSKTLSRKIIEQRDRAKFNTINDLLMIVEEIFIGSRPKYFAQVFQALRIEVNDEIRVLGRLLEQCNDLIKVGGRLSVISYHSLEDRLVKNFMKAGNISGKVEKDDFGRSLSAWKPINKKVILPTEEEIGINSRAKSAKLRIAEKI